MSWFEYYWGSSERPTETQRHENENLSLESDSQIIDEEGKVAKPHFD